MNRKIKTIHIRGLFGYKDLDWELLRDVNILGGENGSGKSTILKACYDILKYGYVNDSKTAWLIKKVTIGFTDDTSIKWGHALDSDIDDNFINTHTLVVQPPLPQTTYAIMGRRQVQYSDYFDENNNIIHTLDKSKRQVCQTEYLNSFEHVIGNDSQEKNNIGLTNLDILIKEQINRRNDIFSNAMSLMFSLDKDKSLAQIAKESPEVSNYLKLIPAVSKFFQDYLIGISENMSFIRHCNGKDEKFNYTGLSTGEKEVLLIMLMVSNTKQEPYIFFMDEPDLALHVKWKQMLIKRIMDLNPNLQLIVSTHSPSVIEGWYNNVKEISQLEVNNRE